MSSYFSSFIYFITDFVKDKLNFWFRSKTQNDTLEIEYDELTDDNLYSINETEHNQKIEEIIDIDRLYKSFAKYNKVLAKTKNITSILSYINNELKYEDKLKDFETITEISKQVEKIEKITILTDLYNKFKILQQRQQKHQLHIG